MRIQIGDFRRGMRIDRRGLTALLRRALRGRKGEVSVAAVSRQKIRAINRQFLGRDRETDVIAFDLADSEEKASGAVIGEIVVSLDRARSEAKRRGHSARVELALYVVHGALHLLGMDDANAADAAAMRRAAREILRKGGFALSNSAGHLLED
ncbi:MAG: rRNA maturation RNase YbeY [Planctomycetes bacterium]|nr:rRNA maturation RNase YbeY [Planctomycetota bacterium]